MQRITPVSDIQSKFIVEFPDGDVEVDALQLMLLWDGCAKGQDTAIRYQVLANTLSINWSKSVNVATAWLVFDTAVKMTTALKKTTLDLENSLPTVSPSTNSEVTN